MSASRLPPGGLTLLNSPTVDSRPSDQAILLKINDAVLREIRQSKETLQLVTGKAPKFRIGSRSLDVALAAEPFRSELYAASSDRDLTFSSLIGHRAELKGHDVAKPDFSATDDAIAKLQSSMASFEQEKKANAANLVNTALPTPKNRFEAARDSRKWRKHGVPDGLESPMSSAGTPNHSLAPTSAPMSDSALRTRAMRIPVVHLLAVRPASVEDIRRKTKLPRDELNSVLLKASRQVDGGKWQLNDRAFKELDVWKFPYPSSQDRTVAVENAIKAYDRQRLGKDDKLWQMLLPKDERGKGKVLSRLHLGTSQANAALTPARAASPLPAAQDHGEGKAPSAATTPRLGPALTPRLGASSKGALEKRLFSKNPQKAQAKAHAAAKEKQRKERGDGASDRDGAGKPAKRQATSGTSSSKVIKSAEFVHSSDEPSSEDEGEVKVDNHIDHPKNVTSTASPSTVSKMKPPSASSESSEDSPKRVQNSNKPAVKRTAVGAPPKPSASATDKHVRTPSQNGKPALKASDSLTAPSQHIQSQTQRSPQKPHSKPNVPSPLGPARPRVASDVSERNGSSSHKARPEAVTPTGLGITTGSARKRTDTTASNDSALSSLQDRHQASDDFALQKATVAKPQTNGVCKAKPADAKQPAATNGVKRKANEMADKVDRPQNNKHRKTDSTSSQSQRSHSDSTATSNSTAQTSPNGASGSEGDISGTITYTQGLRLAQDFRDKYYPAYAKMYDEQADKEARGEKVSREDREHLLQMHHRLEEMKRQIEIASHRQHIDE